MFKLPELPYNYDALAPFINEETMHLHHDKHHQGYTDKLNKALEDGGFQTIDIENILSQISKYNSAIRNNGGGFYNHSLFWKILSPHKMEIPEGDFKTAFERDFTAMDNFKTAFTEAATSQFGSGWAWLAVDDLGKLFIIGTPNQDNPLMDNSKQRGTPILGLDVWEHAYYLDYQNRRPDYVSGFFDHINWQQVADNYDQAVK